MKHIRDCCANPRERWWGLELTCRSIGDEKWSGNTSATSTAKRISPWGGHGIQKRRHKDQLGVFWLSNCKVELPSTESQKDTGWNRLGDKDQQFISGYMKTEISISHPNVKIKQTDGYTNLKIRRKGWKRNSPRSCWHTDFFFLSHEGLKTLPEGLDE